MWFPRPWRSWLPSTFFSVRSISKVINKTKLTLFCTDYTVRYSVLPLSCRHKWFFQCNLHLSFQISSWIERVDAHNQTRFDITVTFRWHLRHDSVTRPSHQRYIPVTIPQYSHSNITIPSHCGHISFRWPSHDRHMTVTWPSHDRYITVIVPSQ